ncbi:MAG: CGNR zinc finger domain-containing protein [Streptosporangiaceae bacterium]
MNFNSHTDAVLAVAVALVNALTPGQARGRPYPAPDGRARQAAARAALQADGASGRRPLTLAEGEQVGAVAAELRPVFEAVAAGEVDTAARTVNALLARTGARPFLDRHDGEPWHLHFHGADESLATGWAAGCATGLAVVLGSAEASRLGVCTAPRCDRVYVDTSRNGTRRFCSTACQNRVKAAVFRERQGSGQRGIPPGGPGQDECI